MKLPHALLIACLGAAPLVAQQVEPKPEAPKPLPPTGNARPRPEQKPVAYVGVLTREVPAELRAQFSLAEGFGLLVSEVMPDSPAKAAGLKVYDVLVKLEDQQLVNMEQFMSLVRAKKIGDVVQLDVITGGKEIKVPITLGEHLIAADEPYLNHYRYHGGPAQPNGMPDFNGYKFRDGDERGFQNQGNALSEQVERFQQAMREYQQRLQEWSKGGGVGPMPQTPELNMSGTGHQPRGDHHNRRPQTGISIPPGTNLQRFNSSQPQTAANVTRRDDSGEYTLKNEDGKKTFIAHPKNGQEQSWPVNTDAERQAMPEEFRDKLRVMNGASTGAPAPPGGDGDAPAPPPVKARGTSA